MNRGVEMQHALSMGLWRTGNRVRRKLGKPALPKPCCRKRDNRRPHTEPGMGPDVSIEKCAMCGCRHFTVLLDPGEYTADLVG